MKFYKFYGIIIIAFAVSFSGCKKIPVNDEKKFNIHKFTGAGHYEKDNKERIEKNMEKPKAVFIGNSITMFWLGSNPAFFESNNYVNRGVGGQSTSQMLLRFRKEVIELNPEFVVINGGINDIAENVGPYKEDFTFGNIVSMAELARANNIHVILTSVLPADRFSWNPEVKNIPEKISSLNTRIEEYAGKNDMVYVDYYSEMIE